MSLTLPEHLRASMPTRPARIEEDVLAPLLARRTPLPEILRRLSDTINQQTADARRAFVTALVRVALMTEAAVQALDAKELQTLVRLLQRDAATTPDAVRDPRWQQIATTLHREPENTSLQLPLLLRDTPAGYVRVRGADPSRIESGTLDFLRYWLRAAEDLMPAPAPATTAGPGPVLPVSEVMLHPVVLFKQSGMWAWAASLLGWQGPLERPVAWRAAGVFVAAGLDERNALAWAILEMARQISRPTRLMVVLPTSATAAPGLPSIPDYIHEDLRWLATAQEPWQETPLPSGLPEQGRIRTQLARLRDERRLVERVRLHIGIPSHESLHEKGGPYEEALLTQLAEQAWTAFSQGKLAATDAPETPGSLLT